MRAVWQSVTPLRYLGNNLWLAYLDFAVPRCSTDLLDFIILGGLNPLPWVLCLVALSPLFYLLLAASSTAPAISFSWSLKNLRVPSFSRSLIAFPLALASPFSSCPIYTQYSSHQRDLPACQSAPRLLSFLAAPNHHCSSRVHVFSTFKYWITLRLPQWPGSWWLPCNPRNVCSDWCFACFI